VLFIHASCESAWLRSHASRGSSPAAGRSLLALVELHELRLERRAGRFQADMGHE